MRHLKLAMMSKNLELHYVEEAYSSYYYTFVVSRIITILCF